MNLSKSILALLFLFSPFALFADWIYFPSEYNKLYNEKYALEIEYENAKNQYENDRKHLEEEIQNLNSHKRDLQEDLEREKRSRDKDKDFYNERLRSEAIRIRALEDKGSQREKTLLEESRDRETRDRLEIEKLQKQLEEQEKEAVQRLRELREKFESKAKEDKERISQLESEISKLKNLTKSQQRELDRLSDQAKELEDKLKSEITLGQIRLKRFHNKLIINLDDKISFESGSADLRPEILPAIEKIRGILANYPENYVIVEGHTDNIPIRTKFRSNWQLSAERALSVLDHLLLDKNLIPKNFSLAGNGEYQPLVPNSTKENRALNRRVDIVVIPRALVDLAKKNE